MARHKEYQTILQTSNPERERERERKRERVFVCVQTFYCLLLYRILTDINSVKYIFFIIKSITRFDI